MNRILLNLNPLTEYAISFISLIGLFFQVRWSRRGTTLGPTLLTTLGIFFCFLGIAMGLADFDPNDVKNSVPHLLQGIRTSFWSSVAGIGWALTIKIRLVMFGDAALASAGAARNATIDDLATQLIRLNTGVAGGNERLEGVQRALDDSAQKTADASGRAMTEAMSAVAADFNGKLTEQFGENFKQLNIAVGRLLTWQVQYETQLNQLIEQETATRETMSVVSQQYSDLVHTSTVFVDTAVSLKQMMGSLEAERTNLVSGLEVLASLIDKTATNLPAIEKTIVEMTNQIARGVQTNQETLGAVLKSSWQSVQAHNQYLTAMLTKSLDAANRDVSTHSRQLDSSVA